MAAVDAKKDVFYHDPELARQVYSVLAELTGRRNTRAAYERWLLRYVKPIAEELGYWYNRWDGKKKIAMLTVKVPLWMIEELDRISEQLEVSRSELVRQIITIFLAGGCRDG